MSIAWPKGLSWDNLTRIGRGTDDDGSDGGMDWQPRRADRHPDAPPRLPIVASRDLPALELAEGATGECADRPPCARADDATPRPLPRSPEPWSEAQLDAVLEILALTSGKR